MRPTCTRNFTQAYTGSCSRRARRVAAGLSLRANSLNECAPPASRRQVLEAIFHPSELPRLGPGFYAASSTFIMPAAHFSAYGRFVMETLGRYERVYQGRGCPFAVGEGDGGVCPVRLLLDSLLHIWAAKNDLSVVYAVDHPVWRQPSV